MAEANRRRTLQQAGARRGARRARSTATRSTRAPARIAASFDPTDGGFGGAPKFPHPMDARACCCATRIAARRRRAAAARDGHAPRSTSMARGGIYDQLGGGFHRYSRRRPLARAALREDALRQRPLPALRRRATKRTGDAVLSRRSPGDARLRPARDDRAPTARSTAPGRRQRGRGRQVLRLDARTRSKTVLGDEAGRDLLPRLRRHDAGNWEGHNILNLPRDPESVAARPRHHPRSPVRHCVARQVQALRSARQTHLARPRREDAGRLERLDARRLRRGLTGVRQGAVPRDGAQERRLFLARIDASGRLTRHAKIPGLLEDYSGVAWGLTLAYEATHERRYLDAARVCSTRPHALPR